MPDRLDRIDRFFERWDHISDYPYRRPLRFAVGFWVAVWVLVFLCLWLGLIERPPDAHLTLRDGVALVLFSVANIASIWFVFGPFSRWSKIWINKLFAPLERWGKRKDEANEQRARDHSRLP